MDNQSDTKLILAEIEYDIENQSVNFDMGDMPVSLSMSLIQEMYLQMTLLGCVPAQQRQSKKVTMSYVAAEVPATRKSKWEQKLDEMKEAQEKKNGTKSV